MRERHGIGIRRHREELVVALLVEHPALQHRDIYRPLQTMTYVSHACSGQEQPVIACALVTDWQRTPT